MSITLVTVAHGPQYRAFLPQWCAAANALQRQPDHIIIVTDDKPHTAAQTLELTTPNTILLAKGRHDHHPQIYVNLAIEAAETDWICKMDVDDLIRPHALTPLDDTEADVWMFGIEYLRASLPAQNVNSVDILHSQENLVFSGSPFRRWLTDKAKFRDMIYEDWAFWIDCAKQDANFKPSPTIDYEYVMHGANISIGCDDAHWRDTVRSLR